MHVTCGDACIERWRMCAQAGSTQDFESRESIRHACHLGCMHCALEKVHSCWVCYFHIRQCCDLCVLHSEAYDCSHLRDKREDIV